MKIEDAASLADVARARSAIQPEKAALIFEGRSTSFSEFDRHSSQIANGLIALGIQPEQRIAYLGKNSDFYFELLIGAAKARMVMTPVNWRLAGPEIAFIIHDCNAPILFVGPEFSTQARALRDSLPNVRIVMTMEGGAPQRQEEYQEECQEKCQEEYQDFAAWRDAQNENDPRLAIGGGDVAIQLYTSGTTGTPKGAMLSHGNFLSLLRAGGDAKPEWNRWQSDDVALVAMPVFHIGGSGFGMLAIYSGATSVIAREFNPAQILDFFEHHGITRLFMVPAAMQFVVRQPRARQMDFSRLRFMMYGASPIPAALLRECIEVFKCGFVQMYGMTETTGTIVALPPEDHVEGLARMKSAGKALPGVELAILDPGGKKLPPGEIGEIATRSGSNMIGYWNLPEATKSTLDADGWLRTGDAGYLDADGYLYIHDRIKDMIISGGENIYPAEVESAICDHPDVAEAAVVGVPDDRWGEAVKAIVVMKPGKSLSPTELVDFARERIAGFKAPKSVDFIEVLPRNASGKILRRALRDPHWAGKDRKVN